MKSNKIIECSRAPRMNMAGQEDPRMSAKPFLYSFPSPHSQIRAVLSQNHERRRLPCAYTTVPSLRFHTPLPCHATPTVIQFSLIIARSSSSFPSSSSPIPLPPKNRANPAYFLFSLTTRSTKFTTTAANSAIVNTVGPNLSSNPPCPRCRMLVARQWKVTRA